MNRKKLDLYNTLKISWSNFAPFSYMSAEGKHVGLDIEIFKIIAKKSKVVLSFSKTRGHLDSFKKVGCNFHL